MRARALCLMALAAALAWAALDGASPRAASAAQGHGPADAAVVAAQGVVGSGLERGWFGANPPTAAQRAQGQRAWGTVYKTLMSPRCMNCHPVGDAPLQTDLSRPHAMNISRKSEANGLKCATCHQTKNSEALGVAGGPPGAPSWHLPPAEMPMIFEGRSERELCEQLKRPQDNGYKTLAKLLDHVAHDKLVLWGWSPGGQRTKPPVPHAEFTAAFDVWVQSGGACP